MEILIVCTGNTCRSPMAAAILNAKLKAENMQDKIQVSSAGLSVWAESRASKGASLVMNKKGLDLQGHHSRQLTVEDVKRADLILAMTAAHKRTILAAIANAQGKVFTLTEFAGMGGEISDPYGGDEIIYQQCAEQIGAVLEKSWQKIVNLAGK